MKHKNPAPHTRQTGFIVGCHTICFKRQTKHHRRCCPARCGGCRLCPIPREGPGHTQAGTSLPPLCPALPAACWQQREKSSCSLSLAQRHQHLGAPHISSAARVGGQQQQACLSADRVSQGPCWKTALASEPPRGPHCSHGELGARRELQLSLHQGLHFPQPPSCGAGSPLLWSCSLAASKDLEIIPLNSKESRVRSFTVFFSFLLLAFSS